MKNEEDPKFASPLNSLLSLSDKFYLYIQEFSESNLMIYFSWVLTFFAPFLVSTIQIKDFCIKRLSS